MINEVRHQSGPTLMFAIPTLGRPVPLEWALNFKSLVPPINYNCDYNIVLGKEIGYARSSLAKVALERNYKYLFFLGDDVVVPPHALRQLIYRMENNENVSVVGGVYCAKADPAAPLVFQGNGHGSYWDWKIGEFFECTGLGMDCTLIRVSDLKKIPEPWFETIDKDSFLDGSSNCEAWTEDLYFCKKVTDAGLRIFCDAAVICEHWDVYNRKAYKLPSDSLPMRQKGVTKDKKCLMLGPSLDLADQSFHVTLCSQNGEREADFRLSFDCLPFEKEEFDFVVVTERILDIEHYIEEWKRVAKVGAKVAFNLHPALNIEYLIEKFQGTKDGTFIELVKES